MKYVRVVFISVLVTVLFCTPAYADLEASSSNATSSDAWMVLSSEPEDTGGGSLGEVIALASTFALPEDNESSFVNMLRFDAVISGDDYILLFSPDYRDDLMVDAAGNLYNVSTSQITGRAFTGSFDPYAEEGTLVYLAPCLGNNFSANRNYGSPNWLRSYYWNSSDRLTYTDEYVQILVTKSHHGFYVSDTNIYIIMILIGGCLLCLWKRSVR